ncbi:SGNH/GDSL hydrolase family protein [Shimia sp. MMG029]|uniref:SGNH/GDSL hydrolase family protein n=1 Tax=Shimia sp. MMG029 TaxID=3021978 RepID=UPI0022FF0707|nr:SGNH/GDSL hydrolase family protein [Shimia sp. MMG029]MDA5556787.1 SGNH/GDSL hydrolase family protein [Shimia sp. MMG029]
MIDSIFVGPGVRMREYLIRAPYTLLLAIGFAVVFLVAGCASTPPLEAMPDEISEDANAAVAASSTTDVVAKNAVTAPEDAPRILAMGDSMMAWHSVTQKSVSHAMEIALGEPVASTAVSGARMLYNLPISGAMGMKIASQYRKGDWDWVVLNGGGNDLWFGCGCGKCTRKMDKLISADGKRGAIPMLVQDLRNKGAQVAWVGYLRSPGAWSPIEGCRDNGDALEARIAKLAALDSGVHFVSLADLVPHGNRSFHSGDMIHPSLKGSRAIGNRVAGVIKAQDSGR